MNHEHAPMSDARTTCTSTATKPPRVRTSLRAGWTISAVAMIPGIGTRSLGAAVDGTGGGM